MASSSPSPMVWFRTASWWRDSSAYRSRHQTAAHCRSAARFGTAHCWGCAPPARCQAAPGGQLGMPQRTAFIGAVARQRCLFLGAALDPARRQPIRTRHGAGHRYVSYLEIVCPVCSSWKRSSDKPQTLVIFPSLLNVKRETRSTSKGSLETESV